MLISNAQLASRAGVDPWKIQEMLAAGDPGAVQSMGAQFTQAGGQAGQATAVGQQASQQTAQAFTADGAPGHDARPATQLTRDMLGMGGEAMNAAGRSRWTG